jgi:hypothetical protein
VLYISPFAQLTKKQRRRLLRKQQRQQARASLELHDIKEETTEARSRSGDASPSRVESPKLNGVHPYSSSSFSASKMPSIIPTLSLHTRAHLSEPPLHVQRSPVPPSAPPPPLSGHQGSDQRRSSIGSELSPASSSSALQRPSVDNHAAATNADLKRLSEQARERAQQDRIAKLLALSRPSR